MSEPTLREKSYKLLRELIICGGLKPDDIITERSLAEKFQMSRTPIRAAIERLHSEGFINYAPNKGISVAEISIEKAVDFFEFRTIIESFVVKQLSERSLSADERKALEDNLNLQREFVLTKNFIEFTKTDSEFHMMLVRFYGNSEITQTLENLQDKLFQIALRVLQKNPSRIESSYCDHAEIYNLIATNNCIKSEAQMKDHLQVGKLIFSSNT